MPRGTLGSAVQERLLTDTVILRRGDAVFLDAQPCRIGTASGGDGQAGAGWTATGSIALYGLPDMDVRRGDLFAVGGSTFRVQLVAPILASPDGVTGANTPVGTKAICEMEQ